MQLNDARYDKTVERRYQVIVRNLLDKALRDRKKRMKERVFSELKTQAVKKYKNLFSLLSENTSFGKRAA